MDFEGMSSGKEVGVETLSEQIWESCEVKHISDGEQTLTQQWSEFTSVSITLPPSLPLLALLCQKGSSTVIPTPLPVLVAKSQPPFLCAVIQHILVWEKIGKVKFLGINQNAHFTGHLLQKKWYLLKRKTLQHHVLRAVLTGVWKPGHNRMACIRKCYQIITLLKVTARVRYQFPLSPWR